MRGNAKGYSRSSSRTVGDPYTLNAHTTRSPQILAVYNCPVVVMVSWFVGVSSHLCCCVMARWWSGCWIGSVFLLRYFVYTHIPWQEGEGWGSRWGGLPTFSGVVLADILVDFVFGVIFTISGICSHSCLCLLAINREVVGTHGVWWCVLAVFIPQHEVVWWYMLHRDEHESVKQGSSASGKTLNT